MPTLTKKLVLFPHDFAGWEKEVESESLMEKFLIWLNFIGDNHSQIENARVNFIHT